MKTDVKFELRILDNGFLLTFYDWKEIEGNFDWREKNSECHFVVEEALDSIRSFMDKEGMV